MEVGTHQGGLGSIPVLGVICGLSLLFVLVQVLHLSLLKN